MFTLIVDKDDSSDVRHIGIGAKGLWKVDTNNQVLYKNCSTWQNVTSDYTIRQISTKYYTIIIYSKILLQFGYFLVYSDTILQILTSSKNAFISGKKKTK